MNKKSDKIFVLLEGVNFGGQQLYIYNIFKCLKSLNINMSCNFGFLFNESTELLSDFTSRFDSVYHCKIHSRSKWKLVFNPLTSFYNFFCVYNYIKKIKPDVIFSNSIYSFCCCSFYKFLNKDVLHIRMIGGDLKRNEAFYHSRIFKYFFPFYDYTDKLMGGPLNLDYYDSLGIDSSKVVLDYDPLSAVDTNMFKPISEKEQLKLRVNYGISKVDYTIGWVGRISDDKEIWETIDLCSYLKKEYPSVKFKFIVIGDGWKRPELEALIFSNNLLNEYLIIEKITQRELAKLYSLIDFEVLLDEDPMGGSHIREAMACERVVISVNGLSGVQAKLIKNGESGFLVDPLNRIKNAAQIIINNYSDRDKLRLIGKNARVFVKNNSYEKLAKIILREISI